MTTRIYCDIADIKQIKKFNNKSIVKGFTTNPSLMRKAGAKNYEKYSKEILKFCKKPISFEVFGDDYKSMKRQAIIIDSWSTNIYVKIPIINSKGSFMGKLIKELSHKNIKLNITSVYKSSQTRKILKCLNKKSKTIISIFAGRAGDVGKDPIPQLKESISMSKKYKNIKILWASVREPYNFLQAKQIGCHLITVPPKIIEKIENFGKSLDQLTIETVTGFLKDSKKSNFKF
ncbi:transaldolase [Candidatus Pelagibacter sp.]|nr:transaldolase [Candidatus Pelagibacter sp.]